MATAIGTMMRMLLVLLLMSQAVQAFRRACEESGYCSLGISKRFVGDISQSQQLRAMLESVAFRKEIILTIYMPQADMPLLWLDPVHQYHHELMEMGYAHHLFVTLNEEHCKQMMLPDASCIWDSSPMPKEALVGETALWHSRWKLMARATRLGYNLLSTDTDFIFWRDPYLHLKSGTLASAQLLCMPEGGSLHNCNGGFIYVQNARPDGPVTWAFKHAVMSTLRRADDGFEFISQFTKNPLKVNCLTFDQSLIMDALISAAVGRPMTFNAIIHCKKGATFASRQGANLTQQQVLDNIQRVWASGPRAKPIHLTPNAQWLQGLGLPTLPLEDITALEGNLTVPDLDYGYPEELGGRVEPEAVGSLSQAFTDMLRADCPTCPWWPERRGAPASGDRLLELLPPQAPTPGKDLTSQELELFHNPHIAKERMVQVPRWVSSSLSLTRRGTFTGRDAPVQGPFLMSHIHSWHLQTSRHHKIMLRKLLGRYNWTVGEAMAKIADAGSPYAMRRDVRRVLALSPDIDLSRTRGWEDLARIIAGLMQLAQLSRRTLLMPDIPCATAWLHDGWTRTNPDESKRACLDYTFYRDANRLPLPVTYLADSRGELVGGWHRRLMSAAAQYLPGAASSSQTLSADSHTPVMNAVFMTAAPQQQMDQGSQAGVGGRLGGNRRLAQVVQQQQSPVDSKWWHQRRYMAAIPAFWDQTCTQAMRAITGPEFHHWLRTDEHAKAAQLQPSPANTAFRVSRMEQRLQLVPPSPPGGDAAAVPLGSLVQPSSEPGWSWGDLQVALPVGQVMEELRARVDVPLLYIGHPVLAVAGHEAAAGEEKDQESVLKAYQKAGRQLKDQLAEEGEEEDGTIRLLQPGGARQGRTLAAQMQASSGSRHGMLRAGSMRPRNEEGHGAGRGDSGEERAAGGTMGCRRLMTQPKTGDFGVHSLLCEIDMDELEEEVEEEEEQDKGGGEVEAGRTARGAQRQLLTDPADMATFEMAAGSKGKAQRRPEQMLARVNARLRESSCKALFVDLESPERVSLERGLAGQLRNVRAIRKKHSV